MLETQARYAFCTPFNALSSTGHTDTTNLRTRVERIKELGVIGACLIYHPSGLVLPYFYRLRPDRDHAT